MTDHIQTPPVTVDPGADRGNVTIYDNRSIHLHGWTWENFVALVNYESMFVGSIARMENVHAAAARFSGERIATGYNGHTVHVTLNIYLYDPEGDVPPVTPAPESDAE